MTDYQTNQPAPDALLTTLDGRSVSLSSFWQNGRFLHLIFLRHLA